MAIFGLKNKASKTSQVSDNLERFVNNFSIEVMPRTAEKVEDFKDHLPKNTRVYIFN
jgi:methylenetetrahydrofolate reductase (NADPH)